MRFLVELIVNGIANRLYELFGYPVYSNNVEQKLNPPCFLVNLVDVSRVQELHDRERRINLFNIVYFPKQRDNITEMYNVQEQLMQGMTSISVRGFGLLHGTDITSKISDGVLNFQVNYNISLRKITATDDVLMEVMDFKGGLIK